MFFSVLFFVLVGIMIFGIFLYPKTTISIKKKPLKRTKQIPKITILIPAYNEEKTIADKIRNTSSIDYPKDKMKVVVIDNGKDKTSEIVKRFPVTLLKSERGKIKAVNKGLEYAKTDVVIITDADVEIESKSIKNMVSYLTGKIGLVNGYVVPKSESFLKDKLDYKRKEWQLRYEEGLIDSICNPEGKLMAFRKSIVSRIPENWLAEDYALTFLIRDKGYRLVVDKSAKVYETLSPNAKEEIKQFKRYAKDIFITNFRNIKFLFNPKYGYFGMMTFPFRRFFPLLYPVFLLYFLVYLFFINPFIALFLLIIGFFFLFIFGKLMLIQMFAIILSYFDLFKKKSQEGGKWDTIR